MFAVSNDFQVAHRLAIIGFYFIVHARFELRLLRLCYCLLWFILSTSRFESTSFFFFFLPPFLQPYPTHFIPITPMSSHPQHYTFLSHHHRPSPTIIISTELFSLFMRILSIAMKPMWLDRTSLPVRCMANQG